MTPDVNVLVAASRADHPHHAAARTWLESALAGRNALTLLPTVAASFLRLVTHPKVFVVPTPIDTALAFIDVVRQACAAHARLPDEWPQLKALCQRHQLRANDLPDAWIAAQVLARDLVLVTFDRDFAKLLPPDRVQRLSA
ncbi:TA system VapC family ribonuclease toxin [Ottowia testudinis]|uniref:Ribonuclease VapC n=1 Tax=Ottowia testudinis TaxID=2816950 RepID=A0A975CM76_9BURK|nr:TA system VapC family ribonuclease toxin [Ottowia testudinis]QTD46754.1 PIN domain-containing protein [Ottowia testudinis]